MLLEQMTVGGSLCNKASCVVLVEASRVAGEGERCWRGRAAGRTAEEELSASCMTGATVDLCCCLGTQGSKTDELPAASRPGRFVLRLVQCRQLRVIVKH